MGSKEVGGRIAPAGWVTERSGGVNAADLVGVIPAPLRAGDHQHDCDSDRDHA
jgi:hypothetical protein